MRVLLNKHWWLRRFRFCSTKIEVEMEENKENESEPRSVAYIHSDRLVKELDKISQIQGRAKLVNSLINAYGLFDCESLKYRQNFY